VCFDGAQPHEQLGGDLCVRASGGGQFSYLLLGSGKDRPGSRSPDVCAHPHELIANAPVPLRRTEPFEDRQGGPETYQRLVLVPGPPVNLPRG
jgi:hypothetical protein